MKIKSLSEESLKSKLYKENFVYKSISSDFSEIEEIPQKLFTKITV